MKKKTPARTTEGSVEGLTIRYLPLAELKPDAYNPRSHSLKHIRQLARSIEAFGFNVPILIDGDCRVVAGHGRLLAVRELGWRQVPTIRLEHLSEAQVRAFRIADNRLSEISEWNERLLAEQLQQLSVLELDFSLETIGFETAEIDLRIESLTTEAVEAADSADNLKTIHDGPSVSRAGDLWLLGDRHRLYCGSALDQEAYDAVLDGDRAAAVFVDPPFNLRVSRISGFDGIKHDEFAMASGEMDERQFTAFLGKALGLLARNSMDGSLHYVCMDWRHAGELINAARNVYTEFENLAVWIKDAPAMGSLYRSQHELIFIFKHGRAGHQNNVQLGRFGRNRSNVWRYPGASGFIRTSEEAPFLRQHPTPKPTRLIFDALLDCTGRNDIVLDSFVGAGTTVLAAERSGRRARAIEIAPNYVDLAVRRWQSHTGDTVRRAGDGRVFTELEEEAEACHAG